MDFHRRAGSDGPVLPLADVEGPSLVILLDPRFQGLPVAVRGIHGQLVRWVYKYSSWT